MPYADIYMEINVDESQKGFGALITQELKKEIYAMGMVPVTHCNTNNQASIGNIVKGGLSNFGFILKRELKQ